MKLQIELDKDTAEQLTMLVNELNVEYNTDRYSVKQLIESAAASLGEGVRRPHSHERQIVTSLTGWSK